MKNSAHIERWTSSQLRSRLGSAFSGAAKRLVDELPETPVYIVTYEYGDWIAAPINGDDRVSGLIPPCGISNQCDLCRQLVADTLGHRPLRVVLRGAVEEYLTIPQLIQGNIVTRRIPLKLAYRSDLIHLVEAVDSIALKNYSELQRRAFKTPIWRTIAGACSVHFTCALGDSRIVKRLMNVTKSSLRSHYFEGSASWTDERFAQELQHSHYRMILLLNATVRPQWKCKLVVLPIGTIIQLAEKNPVKWLRWRSLLVSLAWEATQGLRGEPIRHAAYQQATSVGIRDAWVDETAHHLLNICQGDALGVRRG
jgi:hypothetical protein